MLKSPIVARINTLLAQKGIQKKDFFSACGITSATFSQWNTGEIKSPRKKSLKRVADFLGVSVEYLLYGDGAEKESAPDPKTEGVKKAPATEGEGYTELQKAGIQFVLSLPPEKLERFIKMGRAAFEEDQ